jgi:maltose alpha-D-glucosyltransferase/alpha-amylase
VKESPTDIRPPDIRPPDARKHARAHVGHNDATWYKDAVIYEIRTRSFFDSNGDGVGDFGGLASKLDYLQDLGVSALWLLPFYPSPGRDDGYDISDYTAVHPEVGTLADFEAFLTEAHRRGLRIITELVLNHTSDQHPWFQRARRAPAGSSERNFYVWGDSPDQYRDARIIFKDFEVSNWSWDREAGAYYWHRFYAHQPDLNFENPAVQEALFEVVDFWLAKGVDGLRLDAVPYLYEAEGTNCENLPNTHAFLKKLRAHIDSKFKNRMLLAEANQWPEDAAAYFGQGDECHMNFHFPLMPRLFMSLHQEDRFPIIDIFAQTPEVCPSCQWALFLRNHDELTLEMVTDEERDYMYKAYAELPAMRINLGIRRRLAPLVGNSRRKIELLNGLLLSLPGTPVLYYGDEIGMGDNVYLGDRNGVRTPMQWSMDRNAGFSRANPQRLILPVNIDPEYHYESLNVENQQQNATSLLWWTKRLLALRKRYPAFGRGTCEFLSPDNPRVLAYVREHQGDAMLVVANLSRFTQFARLDLSKHKGKRPLELFGKSHFPSIDAEPYALALGPHDFYWFELEPATDGQAEEQVAAPTIECTSLEALFFGGERSLLDEVLPAFLETRPWFRSALHPLGTATVSDVAFAKGTNKPLWFVFVRAEYADTPPEIYALPLAWIPENKVTPDMNAAVFAFVHLPGDRAETSSGSGGSGAFSASSGSGGSGAFGASSGSGGSGAFGVPSGPASGPSSAPGSSGGALVDALADPESARAVLDAVVREQRFRGQTGEVVGSPLGRAAPLAGTDAAPRELARERYKTALRFGDAYTLTFLRRLDEGVNPELEMARFLARRERELGPPLRGALEFVRPSGEPMTIALVHAYVPNEATAWQYTWQELGRYFERALTHPSHEPCPPPPAESPMVLASQEPPPLVASLMGGYRSAAAQLGQRIAEVHLTLSAAPTDLAFAPEPYSTAGARAKYQSLRNLTGRVLRRLRERLPALAPAEADEARALLANERNVAACFEPLLRTSAGGMRIRSHGNLDLYHALFTGKDFVLTDFSGLPSLSLFERRRRRSPARDLAGMARSFETAALQHLFDKTSVREADVDTLRPWAMHWASWSAASFIQAYFAAVGSATFLPKDPRSLMVQFDALLLERVLYELSAALEEPAPQTRILLIAIKRMVASATTAQGTSGP